MVLKLPGIVSKADPGRNLVENRSFWGIRVSSFIPSWQTAEAACRRLWADMQSYFQLETHILYTGRCLWADHWIYLHLSLGIVTGILLPLSGHALLRTAKRDKELFSLFNTPSPVERYAFQPSTTHFLALLPVVARFLSCASLSWAVFLGPALLVVGFWPYAPLPASSWSRRFGPAVCPLRRVVSASCLSCAMVSVFTGFGPCTCLHLFRVLVALLT